MARTISVDLSMTMTAAVPSADFTSLVPSKSIGSGTHCAAGTNGIDEPPGMTARRLSQPPRTPPAWVSMSVLSGMPISSSTLHGLFTWPEMQKTFVPVFLGRPRADHQAAPLRRIVGATAMLSTLLTVVGRP